MSECQGDETCTMMKCVCRSCDKEQQISGSIAIPIVKSSSWVHNLPTASYDWHLSASDAYVCHQRALRGDGFVTADSVVGANHPRTIMETPKVGKDHLALAHQGWSLLAITSLGRIFGIQLKMTRGG